MTKKRRSTSRAERVAVGIGTALGRLQAKLDRLAVIKRGQAMLSSIGPNTSGDETSRRKRVTKVAKKTAKPRRKVTTAKKSAPSPQKKVKRAALARTGPRRRN
jgi:hypothetical protein